jgi:hypothetical protein
LHAAKPHLTEKGASVYRINAEVRLFTTRIVRKPRQTKWRVGEEKRVVASVNQIVRRIEPLAVETIREDGSAAASVKVVGGLDWMTRPTQVNCHKHPQT